MLAKIHQSLQPTLSEMFLTPQLALVEGLEDVAYITAQLHLEGLWDDYRRAGWHLVPVGGKSEMLQPLIIAKQLKIPVFAIFDSDPNKPDKSGSLAKARKDNEGLLKVLCEPSQEPLPAEDVWGSGFVMWHSDIGSSVADDIGSDWAHFQSEADRLYGHAGSLRKNALHIATSLSLARDAGKKSNRLRKLYGAVLGAS